MVLNKNDSAVSPVVGVMLMLVVVIVIASAVTLFASGLLEDTPHSSVSGGTVSFVGADTVLGGFVFKNSGGGIVDLRELQFQAVGSGGSFTIVYNDKVWTEKYEKRSSAIKKRKELNDINLRMVKYGSDLTREERENPVVEAGEAFIIYGESYNSFSGMGLAPIAENGGTSNGGYGAIGSGAVSISDTTKITLKNVNTGKVYLEQRLSKGDILT